MTGCQSVVSKTLVKSHLAPALLHCVLIIFRKMESKIHQVRVTNRKLSRSAIVPATTFVEFKRKLVTELCMSGWFSVKVYKAESFEVRKIY